MRNTKILLSLLGLVLAAVTLAAMPPAHAGGGATAFLVAGQHEEIGVVNVTDDGANLTVVYHVFKPGWALSLTHLYVDTEAPRKAAPGRFTFKTEHDPAVRHFEYVIPFAELGVEKGDCLYVAAHADSRGGSDCYDADIAAFCGTLPATAEAVVSQPGPGGVSSYFDVRVREAGWMNGTYDGGCVDTDRTISPGAIYPTQVFCSYDPKLADYGLVEHPENMDQLNWILNQDFPGKNSPNGHGTYTYGDVQRAVWELVEDELSTEGLGPWSPARVHEILRAGEAHGVGYVPGCGERVVVLLNPVRDLEAGGTIAQVIYALVPVVCECKPGEETAWGLGGPCAREFRTGWGEYFKYRL